MLRKDNILICLFSSEITSESEKPHTVRRTAYNSHPTLQTAIQVNLVLLFLLMKIEQNKIKIQKEQTPKSVIMKQLICVLFSILILYS